GGTAHFTYDELGQVIHKEQVIDEQTTYTSSATFDALGRPVTVTYPDLEVINYEYNNFGDVEKIYSDQTQYVVQADYNPSGQLTTLKYGNGSETNYDYDLKTLRLKHLDTNSAGTAIQNFDYTFDQAGNVKSITDHVNTASQTFGYDNLYRLTNAVGASYGTHQFEYDPIGNRTAQIKNDERTDYFYGENNGPVHAVTSAKIDGQTKAAYRYDANGNMREKWTPDKGIANYEFNPENRLAVVDEFDSQPHTITLNFQPGWNFFSLPYLPADTKIASVFAALTYGVDYKQISHFNASTQNFEHFVNDPDFNDFDTFEYGRGYLIWVENPAGVNITVTGKLPSDDVVVPIKSGNNLISFAISDEAGVEASKVLEDLKQGEDYSDLVEYTPAGYVSVLGGKVYPGKAYYLKALQDFDFNLAPTTETTQFIYDSNGARVKKIMGTDSITYFGEDFEVAKYLGTGFAAAYTTVTSKYLFLGGRRIAATENDGTEVKTYYYHSDHLGGSNTITDENGRQVELVEYTPYGEISRHEVDPETRERRHKFTGQEQDKETGLYYYGARYYDPEIGRFISPDSFVQDPSDPQSFNRYAYARNNPVNLIDPTGNFWETFLAVMWVISQIAAWVSLGATIVSMIAYYSGDYETASLFSDIARIAGIVSTVTGSIAKIGNIFTTPTATAEQGVTNAAPKKVFGLFSVEIPEFGVLDVLDIAAIGFADTSAGPILNNMKLAVSAWNMLTSMNGNKTSDNPTDDSSVEVYHRGLEGENGQPKPGRVHPFMRDKWSGEFHELQTVKVGNKSVIKILEGDMSKMSKGTQIYWASNPRADQIINVSKSKFYSAIKSYKGTLEGMPYKLLNPGLNIHKYN
ncbi:MAG: hypothetical protein HY586_04660, partial [Candidatus Omnitrophica bacterium]|nr:hypothetical protein [Candidatus Omnitrophota bacterium]